MLNNIYKMKNSLKVIVCFAIVVYAISLPGQMRIPRQELPHSPQEMVALSSDIEFSDAVTILGKIAMQFEGKTIIDPTQQSGPIDIDIPNMYWRSAFKRILDQRGLEFEEYANYYQIVEPEGGAVAQTGAAKAVQGYNRGTREVQINAIFFQADRRKLQNAGINWNVLQNSPGLSLGTLNIGADFGIISQQAAGNEDQTSGRKISHYSTDADGSIDVEALLNIFESRNLGKILSKPSIKVVDGKTGEIHVGTQFAINQRDFAGNTVTQFANAGTILRVTPAIIEDSSMAFIHLNLSAEKSAARAGMGDRPEISTQKATTDILMIDGEQTMIGGLFVQDKQETREGIPILKDLPWWVFGIRYIAGYNSVTIDRNELIIFIQVELVETLSNRVDQKKRELLSSSANNNRHRFNEEFKDLENVNAQVIDQPVKDDPIEQQRETQLNTEKSKETVPVKPRPQPKHQKTETSEVTVQAKETPTKTEPEKVKEINQETQQLIKKIVEKDSSDSVVPKTKKAQRPVPPVTIEKSTQEESKPDKPDTKTQQVASTTDSEESRTETKEIEEQTKPDSVPVQPATQKARPKTVSEKQKAPEKTEVKKPAQEKPSDDQKLEPRYTIQIFSSDNYKKTMQEVDQFKARGIDVYITKKSVNGKIYYRMRSGRYRNFSDAKKHLEKIQQLFPTRKDMWIDNL